MALDKLVDSSQLDSDLNDLANAILAKSNGRAPITFPAGFVTEVESIETGITPSGTKTISIQANGETTEDVTDYAEVDIQVEVPNSYAAGDEGKVVSGGALVSQCSATYQNNGTYDTTLKSSVTVQVPVPTLSTLTATDNGTYTPAAGAAYSSVIVSIPSATGVSF